MKILSLFDGISCARVALERAGIPVEFYYASETDKYAMQVSAKNYPDIVQVGSVVDFHPTPLICGNIDLMVGGSPCQDLSIAKKDRKGLDGERSGLFWEYVRILKEVKPKYFILENVNSMPKEAKAIITETLGVEPIMINAALVSAQNRKRLFWTNIPNVTQPKDKGILLKDILENGDSDRLKSYCIDASYYKGGSLDHYLEKGTRQIVFCATNRKENIQAEHDVNACSFRGRYLIDGKRKDATGAKTEQRLEIGGDKANTITKVYKDSMVRIGQIGKGGQGDRIYSPEGKSVGLSALSGGRGPKTGLYQTEEYTVRKLTPIECERLQSLPDNYTEGVSNSQRYKALGNAFNVDVIAHIITSLL